jgi:predicted nucleic-acid-binding Zn-ribbon protein
MSDAKNITVDGKELKCMYCGCNKFWQADTLLNKKWLAVFDLEAWSKTGKAYICDECGYKHEFISKKGL